MSSKAPLAQIVCRGGRSLSQLKIAKLSWTSHWSRISIGLLGCLQLPNHAGRTKISQVMALVNSVSIQNLLGLDMFRLLNTPTLQNHQVCCQRAGTKVFLKFAHNLMDTSPLKKCAVLLGSKIASQVLPCQLTHTQGKAATRNNNNSLTGSILNIHWSRDKISKILIEDSSWEGTTGHQGTFFNGNSIYRSTQYLKAKESKPIMHVFH